MSKRPATELQHDSIFAGQPHSKASGGSGKRENVTVDEMGEFEDAWEDELESDEDVVDGAVEEPEAEEREDGAYLR
jgi:ribosome assembly protein RRB1